VSCVLKSAAMVAKQHGVLECLFEQGVLEWDVDNENNAQIVNVIALDIFVSLQYLIMQIVKGCVPI
jgi:hypothetical protein